jgi:hypothetical protein
MIDVLFSAAEGGPGALAPDTEGCSTQHFWYLPVHVENVDNRKKSSCGVALDKSPTAHADAQISFLPKSKW